MPAPKSWSDAAKLDVIDSYRRGDTTTAIARKHDTSHVTIARWLRVWGVSIRCGQGLRVRSCDDGYFDEVDCEAKAYWLGFLAADGCITNGNQVSLNLGLIDLEHLKAFRTSVGGDQAIHLGRTCSLKICSSQMVASLARWGIHPRKTFTAFVPALDARLSPHYWRGVVDGDGCLSVKSGRITLVGNRHIVSAFKDFCAILNPAIVGGIRARSTIFQFAVSGRMARPILIALYANASMSLPRKAAKYRKIAEAWGAGVRPRIEAVGVEPRIPGL